MGWRSEGERVGEEKESRYRAMKKSSLRAQNANNTLCKIFSHSWLLPTMQAQTHLVRVIQMENPTPALIHLLVTARTRHRQRRIHVHVVARKIQADEALEQQRPSRPRGAEEDEEAGCRAAICDHVQHGAELGGLLKVARGDAVEGVEEAGDAVEDGAGAWVEGHVVEGGDGEDDAGVSWEAMLRFGRCSGVLEVGTDL